MEMWLCILLLLAISHLVASQPVESLPGFSGHLPLKLETGYVGVDEGEDVQLFYYFTESERSPEQDPLLLWLTGGPGCSSFSALAYQLGPLQFDYENSGGVSSPFIPNPYSWTKIANLLFLDQPVGTGFSYSRKGDYQGNGTIAAQYTYNFLRKWLIDHPKHLKNPLYIAGESASGLVIPMIIQEILNGMKMGHEPLMNLKGYVLGNPLTDMNIEMNSRVEFAHHMSLLPKKLYQSAKRNCNSDFANVDPENAECVKDLQLINKCVEDINALHILEPKCPELSLDVNVQKQDQCSPDHQTPTNFVQLPSPIPEKICRYYNYYYAHLWANDESVRKALHVRQGTKDTWVRCNKTLPYFIEPNYSVLDYHRNFAKLGLRVLIYSGDHDYAIPSASTEAWIESLNLPVESDWHPWYVDGQIAGYTTAYSNHNMFSLTYATVKGAGHVGTLYKPRECFAMANRWFADQPL